MARRNTKAKKAVESDVKVSENEAQAPKKGRGKIKIIDEVVKPIEDIEHEESEGVNEDVEEKAPVEKKKRGKKALENGEQNGEAEVAPAKRGRKKNVEPSVDTAAEVVPIETPTIEEPIPAISSTNGDISADPELKHVESEKIDEMQTDGVPESKSKKKPAKKDLKNNEKENGEVVEKAEEKPKGKGRGRKAQPKAEAELEPESVPEEVKTEPAKPKKGRGKAAKEKIPEDPAVEDRGLEEKFVEEKPKKGRGKAAVDKTDENSEENNINDKSRKGKGKAGKELTPDSAAEDNSKDNQSGEKPEPEKASKAKGKGKAAKELSPESTVEDNSKENQSEEKSEPEKITKAKGKENAAKELTPDSSVEANSEENQSEEKSEPEKVTKALAKGRPKGKKNFSAKEENDDPIEEHEAKEPASKKRKVNKKDKGQGDMAEHQEEDTSEPKLAKGKRGQKRVETPEAETEPEDTGEANNRRRKPAEDKAPAKEAKQKAPLKNKTSTTYEDIDFSNTAVNSQGKEWNFKIASWNVDGIRAWMTKGGLDYIQYEKPDILCLQEVKCSLDKLPEECKNIPGYHAYWLCSDKDGYAGVGIYTTKLAMNVQYGLQNEELDSEGRIITAEYEQFYLICTYVPNAGRKLVTLPKRLEWNEAFRNHVKELDKKKPVIICGDMNVAHNEIDLANPKSNRKNAGFTEEERAGMTELLGEGFVDTYRHLYPDNTGAYTFWTYMGGSRAKNVGWRLDYFLVSQRLIGAVSDCVIRSQVYGSDHCPITLFLHLTTADKPKEE